MKTLLKAFVLILVASTPAFAQQTTNKFPKLTGRYLGQKPPGKTPEPFAANIFASRYSRHHSVPVFSPDGKQAYWEAREIKNKPEDPKREWIFTSKIENGYWTEPKAASFSLMNMDDDSPFISSDGKHLFLLTSRPVGKGGEPDGAKIWVMERENDNWSEPKPLPPVINSLKIHWQFSVDRKGDLYFGVWKVDRVTDDTTDFNIYYSKFEKGDYSKPEKLGSEINNSQCFQYSPYVAPDGSYLMFTRQSKASEPQLIMSIFMSFREKDGSWSEAKEIDDIIRMHNHDIAQPSVTPDGKYFVFQRVVGGHSIELYWADAGFIAELRKRELK